MLKKKAIVCRIAVYLAYFRPMWLASPCQTWTRPLVGGYASALGRALSGVH